MNSLNAHASQDIPTLVSSISDLHDLEMGVFGLYWFCWAHMPYHAIPYRVVLNGIPHPLNTHASQDIPTLVRSISDLHDMEMGGFLRVNFTVPVEDLLGGGLVHRHIRPRDIPAQ